MGPCTSTYTVSLSLQFRYDRNILHILCIVIWSHLFSSFRWRRGPILFAQTNENSHRHRPRFKVSAHRVAASFRYIRSELQFSIRYNRFYVQTELWNPLQTIANDLTEIILMSRLTTSSIEALPATRRDSSDLYVGVGTQIRVASLHKAMLNAPPQGSSPVFVR